MQTIGDSFRSIDNDVFANYLVRQCSDNKIYIVDDLRFKNEYNILRLSLIYRSLFRFSLFLVMI